MFAQATLVIEEVAAQGLVLLKDLLEDLPHGAALRLGRRCGDVALDDIGEGDIGHGSQPGLGVVGVFILAPRAGTRAMGRATRNGSTRCSTNTSVTGK